MAVNIIQLRGPFKTGVSFLNEIKNWKDNYIIETLAIQINPYKAPILNRNTKDYQEEFAEGLKAAICLEQNNVQNIFKIGYTGVLELSGMSINKDSKIYFLQDEPDTTLVDIILIKEDIN